MATVPILFLGMFPVSLVQVGQGEPSPLLLLLFPSVMMVGPWAAGAGGGG